MIDLFDMFDLYQQGKIADVSALQANTDQRLTNTAERVRAMEIRVERMKLVTTALWELLKEHTGMTDADLKRYIERVDLADGRLDGKISSPRGAMDCPHCSRRMLKSAVSCPWCCEKVDRGNAFEAV